MPLSPFQNTSLKLVEEVEGKLMGTQYVILKVKSIVSMTMQTITFDVDGEELCVPRDVINDYGARHVEVAEWWADNQGLIGDGNWGYYP